MPLYDILVRFKNPEERLPLWKCVINADCPSEALFQAMSYIARNGPVILEPFIVEVDLAVIHPGKPSEEAS